MRKYQSPKFRLIHFVIAVLIMILLLDWANRFANTKTYENINKWRLRPSIDAAFHRKVIDDLNRTKIELEQQKTMLKDLVSDHELEITTMQETFEQDLDDAFEQLATAVKQKTEIKKQIHESFNNQEKINNEAITSRIERAIKQTTSQAALLAPCIRTNDCWKWSFMQLGVKNLHQYIMTLPSLRDYSKQMERRILVIAKNDESEGNMDRIMQWVKPLRVPYILIPGNHSSQHNLGEANSWLRYIVDHYDHLPDHVVFLSDSGPHWHAPTNWVARVRGEQPICRSALGLKLEDHNFPERTEIPLISNVLRSITGNKYAHYERVCAFI